MGHADSRLGRFGVHPLHTPERLSGLRTLLNPLLASRTQELQNGTTDFRLGRFGVHPLHTPKSLSDLRRLLTPDSAEKAYLQNVML